MVGLGRGFTAPGNSRATAAPSQSAGPIRSQLIAKGTIHGRSRGDTGLTVSLFDQFMRRLMPSMK
jgi:hypothetical protein